MNPPPPPRNPAGCAHGGHGQRPSTPFRSSSHHVRRRWILAPGACLNDSSRARHIQRPTGGLGCPARTLRCRSVVRWTSEHVRPDTPVATEWLHVAEAAAAHCLRTLNSYGHGPGVPPLQARAGLSSLALGLWRNGRSGRNALYHAGVVPALIPRCLACGREH